MDERIRLQNEMGTLIEAHYKGVDVPYCQVAGAFVYLIADGLKKHLYPFAAKRLLKAYPWVRFVNFITDDQDFAYSRETLKYGGYWK